MLVCRASRETGDERIAVRRELDYVLAPWRRPHRGLAAVLRDQQAVRKVLAEGIDAALVWHMRGVVKTSLRLLQDAGIPVLYMLHDRWVLYERPGPWLGPWPWIDRHGLGIARESLGVVAPRLELRAPPVDRNGVVCFASQWLRDEYARLGWRPTRGRVLPAGVDADGIGSLRLAPPASPPRRALYAGRIHPTKGLDVVIRALAESPSIHLAVAGHEDDPAYAARVRSDARALGVDSRVSWLGHVSREEVLHLLASHDVFIYPSIAAESGRLGLLEGLAAGAIVVTSAVGAPREVLVDGQNALVFPPGDAAALRECLQRLRAEPELGGALAAAGRETARRESLDRTLDAVEATLVDARADAQHV